MYTVGRWALWRQGLKGQTLGCLSAALLFGQRSDCVLTALEINCYKERRACITVGPSSSEGNGSNSFATFKQWATACLSVCLCLSPVCLGSSVVSLPVQTIYFQSLGVRLADCFWRLSGFCLFHCLFDRNDAPSFLCGGTLWKRHWVWLQGGARGVCVGEKGYAFQPADRDGVAVSGLFAQLCCPGQR